MILDEVIDTLLDTLVRGAGMLVLGILGRNMHRQGAEDDWAVFFTGIAFWVVLGTLSFFLVKWIV